MNTVADLPAATFSGDALLAGLAYARGRVDVRQVAECESSNALLLEMARNGAPAGTVVLADRQTAGRGRRGRTWHQSAHGLAFSLLWRLPEGCNASGLSLAVGLAVAESIGDGAKLKWPNDVLLGDRKVAGILIESSDPGMYVIGIGVNIGQLIGVPDAIVSQAASVDAANREAMLADILNRLVAVLDVFGERGFAVLQQRWMARHAFQDVAVTVAERQLAGICRGVDEAGALLIQTSQGIQPVMSGDVSLRKQ